jgi:hypothetical protein
LIAFLSVVVIWGCPTTWSKTAGRYFLAETTKFFISRTKLIYYEGEKKVMPLTRR